MQTFRGPPEDGENHRSGKDHRRSDDDQPGHEPKAYQTFPHQFAVGHDAQVNQSEDHRPVIGFAHRGARAHAPENTIEGFLTAIRMGAKALETDVWLTRDGVAMLAHDGKLGRGRPISATDHAEMPALMPTLRRLGEVVSPDTDLSIDVKDPAAIEAILAARADTGASALRHTWLCDPEPDRLAGWRSLDPDVQVGS